MPKNIIQQVFNPAGLDLRSSDIVRDINMSPGGKNYIRTHSGHLVKRKGYQIKATEQAGYGLAQYEKRVVSETGSTGWGNTFWGADAFGDPAILSTGQIDKVLVAVEDTPKIWTQGVLTITYSGANTATVQVQTESTSDIHLKLVDNGTEVLDYDCGDGTETSPTATIADLVTDISAVSNFTASASGDTTVSSAYLNTTGSTVIASGGGSISIIYGYWTDIYTPNSDTWGNLASRVSRDDFENASTVSLNGVLYFANGRNDLHKYDGQTFYRAGMPDGETPSPVVNATAGNLNGNYIYKIAYKQKDRVGNITTGAISTVSATVAPSSEQVDLTFNNILSTSGFNTNCAVASGGNSTNITTNQEKITVTSGHTLQVGDIAYFYDNNTTSYQELEILDKDATSITVNSAATLNLDASAVISNNLRVIIYRTIAGGTALFYEVAEIPNNSFSTTSVYTDNIADANLGAEFIEPIKTPGLPPKGKYLSVWNNQLIIAGNLDNPNRIYYSYFADVVSPESFPAANFAEVGRGPGGIITGLGLINRNLVVFNELTTWIAEGNLSLDIIRFDPISTEIGCVSHNSIANLNNKILWLSSKGVYSFNGRNLERIGTPLDPIFTPDSSVDFSAAEKRTVATVWEDHSRYVLFLPVESDIGSNPYANSNSAVYVWDDTLKLWFPWDNINAIGGLVTWDDGTGESLWFQSREESGVNRLYKMNNSLSESDYADHISAITMEYETQWIHGGFPTVDKQFVNLQLYGLYEGARLGYTPSGTWTIIVEKNFNKSNTESTLTALPTETNPYVTKSLRSTKKRAIRFIFKNSELTKQALLTGFELSYWPYRMQIRR